MDNKIETYTKCEICAMPTNKKRCVRHEMPKCFRCGNESNYFMINGISSCNIHINIISNIMPKEFKHLKF